MRITKDYISTRKKPINLENSDNYLFEDEYSKLIRGSNLKLSKNIYVDNIQLKKFKYFKVFYSDWRMNDQKLAYKLKFFINDLKNYLTQGNVKEVVEINAASWVIDVRSDQFFHWTADVLQRIEILGKFVNDYPILIPNSFLKYSYVTETLKALDIQYISYNQDDLLKIKNLYITSHGAQSGNYNESLINSIRDKFLNSIGKKPNLGTYIWVSRQKSKKRKIANFEEIRQVINRNGFQIVEFDELPFNEQLNISNNAEVIAGIHGAGLSHMFYSKNIKKIIEVRVFDDDKNNCFYSMASALNIDYYYFKCESEGNPYNSNYILNPEILDLFLKGFIENN